MSAMIYENGIYKEAETPKVWNGNAYVDTEGYYWENGVQKEGWSKVQPVELVGTWQPTFNPNNAGGGSGYKTLDYGDLTEPWLHNGEMCLRVSTESYTTAPYSTSEYDISLYKTMKINGIVSAYSKASESPTTGWVRIKNGSTVLWEKYFDRSAYGLQIYSTYNIPVENVVINITNANKFKIEVQTLTAPGNWYIWVDFVSILLS